MAYSDIIRAATPSLYWTLDATTGATDQSGNSRNGTGAGSISIGAFSGSPIVGETTSTQFTKASSQFISSTYDAAFTAATVRSAAGWIYYNALDLTQEVFFGSGAGGFGYLYVVNQSGAANVIFSPDNSHFTGVLGVLPIAAWTHWAFIFDQPSNTATLYLNGVAGTPQAMATDYTGLTGFRAGATGAFFYLDGKMAHLAAWERALTASEIQGFYRAGIGTNNPGLRSEVHHAGSNQ